MTLEQLCACCCIPSAILKEYQRSGLAGKADCYDDEDVRRISLLMTLREAGFSSRQAEQYLRLYARGPACAPQLLELLNRQRKVLLDQIHLRESQLELLDQLRHSTLHPRQP